MTDWLEIVDLSGGVTAWICQRRDFPTKNVGRWWKPKDLNEIIEMILRTKPVEVSFYTFLFIIMYENEKAHYGLNYFHIYRLARSHFRC